MLRLKFLKLVHQLVEFGVADLGVIEHVVAVLVVADLFPEASDLFVDVFGRSGHDEEIIFRTGSARFPSFARADRRGRLSLRDHCRLDHCAGTLTTNEKFEVSEMMPKGGTGAPPLSSVAREDCRWSKTTIRTGGLGAFKNGL